MKIDVDYRDGAAIFRVQGRINLDTARALDDKVKHSLEAGGPAVLELSGVDYCASAGIGVMVSIHSEYRLGLAGLSQAVRSVLELSEVIRLLNHFDTVEQAVAYVTSPVARPGYTAGAQPPA